MIKTKHFGAVSNEELTINGTVTNNCHAELVSASNQCGNPETSWVLTGSRPQDGGHWMAKRNGFTLAEVLITLVVIGVVAAITIPVLHSNTGGKEWNAAKQKARAGIAEAFKLAGVNQDLPDITAKEFVKTVLPKYLKLAKTCDTAQECGFPNKIKTVDGNEVNITGEWKWNSYAGGTGNLVWNGKTAAADWSYARDAMSDAQNTPAAFFRTVDGFSAAMFYNPRCRAGELDNPWFASNEADGEMLHGIVRDTPIGAACFSAIYDMKGKKGPNRAGDDIGFAGSFYYGVQARSA